MGTNVRDVMTSRPRSVTPETTLRQVAELMEAEDVGAIPVVEGDRLVGMVTDRDIVIRAISRGLDPGDTRVSQIASEDLVTIDPGDDLSDALELMARYQVRRLLGVVSQADVALQAKEKATGEMVEDISRPPSGPRTVGPDDSDRDRDESSRDRDRDESTSSSRLP